jgi:hypothetical protein
MHSSELHCRTLAESLDLLSSCTLSANGGKTLKLYLEFVSQTKLKFGKSTTLFASACVKQPQGNIFGIMPVMILAQTVVFIDDFDLHVC